MPTISRAYHAHAGNYTPGGNSHQYIVVHNTGNTASALNEAKYAQNNRHDSSYHYVLDGNGTIYQVLDDWDTAWSVGAWRGARQLIRNDQSINIEVCTDGGKFSSAEEKELAWLVQRLMSEYNIPANHVVRHYDCHTGHKQCPGYYSGSSAADKRWEALHSLITGGGNMDWDELWFTNIYDSDADWGIGGKGSGKGYPTLYNLFYNIVEGQGVILDNQVAITERLDAIEKRLAEGGSGDGASVSAILDAMSKRLAE